MPARIITFSAGTPFFTLPDGYKFGLIAEFAELINVPEATIAHVLPDGTGSVDGGTAIGTGGDLWDTLAEALRACGYPAADPTYAQSWLSSQTLDTALNTLKPWIQSTLFHFYGTAMNQAYPTGSHAAGGGTTPPSGGTVPTSFLQVLSYALAKAQVTGAPGSLTVTLKP